MRARTKVAANAPAATASAGIRYATTIGPRFATSCMSSVEVSRKTNDRAIGSGGSEDSDEVEDDGRHREAGESRPAAKTKP